MGPARTSESTMSLQEIDYLAMTLPALCRLADDGDASAQAQLAFRYSVGEGVRRDRRLAIRWGRLAADAGNVSAKFNLAQDELEVGGTAHVADALVLLEQVWNEPDAESALRASAAVNIGWVLKNGEAGASDTEQVERWYVRAARLGNARAMYNLGLLFSERADPERMRHFFRLAAELGHEGAVYELARLHVDRRLVDSDLETARTLLQRISPRHARARRLLRSRRLAAPARVPEQRTVARAAPDRQLHGCWSVVDQDAWLHIQIPNSEPTRVIFGDDEELFEVDHVTWDEGSLRFSTRCVSTNWRVDHKLLFIDQNAALMLRAGDSCESSVASRRPDCDVRVHGRGGKRTGLPA